jgi:PAS domain S-box-containing protein
MISLLYTLYIPLLLIAAVLAAVLAFYTYQRIAAPGARVFVALMSAVAVWSAGYALRLYSETLPGKTFWAQVQFVGVVVAPTAWLLFVAVYTGRERWFVRRRSQVLWALEPAAILLLVWTNRWHGLVWTETSMVQIRGWLEIWQATPGIALWVHAAYSYVLMLLGTGLLVEMLIRSPLFFRGSVQHRGQVVALLIGLLTPWLANALSTTGWIPFPLDLTPFGFIAAGLVVTWALLQLRLFSVVPVARSAALSSITDGVFVMDTQGRIVYLNPSALRMIDVPRSVAIGMPLWDLLRFHPGAADKRVAAQTGRGESLLTAGLELWVQPARAPSDQRIRRTFEVRARTIHTPQGQPSGQLVILQDVTERNRQRTLYRIMRKLAGQLTPEAVMQAAVESIAELVGESYVMIVVPTSDGTCWTIRAAKAGLAPGLDQVFPLNQGIVGRTLRTAKTQVVPDVRLDADYVDHHPAVESHVSIPLKRGDRVLGALCLESERLAAYSADEVRLYESLAEAIALSMDSARLYMEAVNERQRLMTLIESSRDGIILVGLDKRVLVINAPAAEFLGLEGSPLEWANLPIRKALDVLEGHAPEAAEDLWAELSRIGAGDEPVGEGEFEVFPRAIQWVNLPVSVDHVPLGRLLVLHDVTEERLLLKMREDLTHTMVHDLRNPLTGISTALQLLDSKLEGVITPAQHRLFEIAANSTQKMVDLVNSILDLSRLEKGRMPLSPEPVSLPDILAETLRLQSPLSSAKKLHIVRDVAPTLPLAWADGELVARVLQNLIGNAIKFTPAGGTITIAARQVDGEAMAGNSAPKNDEPTLRISVTDSGPGVSPEFRDKLFQKFVVGEQQERGSGLGLAFCKLAVEAHGGEIWVEDGPEQGARFVFTLPGFDEDELESML